MHALGATALWWAFQRSETITITDSGTAEISGLSWEVEAPTPPPPVPAEAQPVTAAQPDVATKPDSDPSIDTASLPTTHEAAPSPAARPASGVGGPPATEVQIYLATLRKHLSDAIQINSISGMAPTSLILKISISRTGAVTRQEIEKSSGDPEMDAKVLIAFQSILPLPPFPENWKKGQVAPQVLNVRLPIEIHSHTR
jgi:TonB family protein